MRNVFKTYAKTLENIAHLMPPDLNRFLDQESQVNNCVNYEWCRWCVLSMILLTFMDKNATDVWKCLHQTPGIGYLY